MFSAGEQQLDRNSNGATLLTEMTVPFEDVPPAQSEAQREDGQAQGVSPPADEEGPYDSGSDSGFDSGSLLGDETDTLASSIMNYRIENGRQYHAYRDGAYWGVGCTQLSGSVRRSD